MIDPTTQTYGICPPRDIRGFESYTGRGTIHIARAIYEGRLKVSEKLASHIYSKCLLCRNCQVHCPNEVNVTSVMKALREEIARAGMLPLPLKERDGKIQQDHNVLGNPPSKRGAWAERFSLGGKGEVLYFAGCYDSYRYPTTAIATVAILKEAGLDVCHLGKDEWCCGLPALHDGNIALAEECAMHNAERIAASGAKKIVTSCPGCYTALKSEYPSILGNGKIEVAHISQVVSELLEAGKIKMTKTINRKITYHDPCHLGRYEGIYDEPRRVIGKIPGIEMVEMLRNQKQAWCCGAGTETNILDNNLSTEIAKTRIKEACQTGADELITACPQCLTILTQAAKRTKMRVRNLPVVVAEAMGIDIK